MKNNLAGIAALIIFLTAALLPAPARAGLDLANQTEIDIPALDLDGDGRIRREEAAEYLFYYFDRDGNETLTNGEYSADREISVLPYEASAAPFVDLDGDGKDDGAVYTTESFLAKTMTGEYDPPAEGAAAVVTAKKMTGMSFLKTDDDRSGAIEMTEWRKAWLLNAAVKPKQPPKAANQNRYN